MFRHFTLAALCGLSLASACANSETPPDDTMANVRDVRVPIPEPDPAYVDFVGPEAIIAPGEEKMTCLHVRHDGEGVPYSVVDGLQGKFGHHAALLKAKKPEPPGTAEDCTKPEDMAKYDLLTITGLDVKPGYALWLPGGVPMVYQSHYVNAGQQPIRIRDVLRFKKVAIQDVKTWVTTFATSTIGIAIPPSQSAKTTFDCELPFDTDMMVVFGHMHDIGTRFKTWLGPNPASLQEIYKVDAWMADYRDNPPVSLHWNNPMPLTKGTVLRTECEWNNTHAMPVGFPMEMCLTLGMITGRKEPWSCRHGE